MKNRLLKKIILAVALFCLFGIYNTNNVYASNENKAAIATRAANRVSITDTKWTTVAESRSGFNCNVYITVSNTWPTRTSIRMLGKNGNVVWEKEGAIAFNQFRARFWCGADVYKIQLITMQSTGSAYVDW